MGQGLVGDLRFVHHTHFSDERFDSSPPHTEDLLGREIKPNGEKRDMWSVNYWALVLYFVILGGTIAFFRTSDNKDESFEEPTVEWNTAIERRLEGK